MASYKFEKTARIHTIGFPPVEEQTYEVEIKKSVFFVNSSPEAIVHLVQKALFTYL